jgi:hypothetical protein
VVRRCLTVAAVLVSGLAAATPAEFRQHVGIYVWGHLRSVPNGGLAQAAADLKRLGADGLARVYIGPGAPWNASGTPDNSPLDVKARRADYRAFFAAFPVVMLTAYDSANYNKYKDGHLTPQQLTATRDEFRSFTLELAKMPGRKIVSNWEFENDCAAGKPANKQRAQWDACREYYQARLDGIREGRTEARSLGYPGEVLSAFEFTIVPGYVGKPSGLVEVGGKLSGVDYFSYSSWASIGWDYDAPTMYKSFEWGAQILHRFSADHHLSDHWILGEFGEYWDQHPTSERMKTLIDAALAGGFQYLFDWVLYDQPGEKDDHGRDASHFGKYTLEGALTPQGKAFRSWFGGAAGTK